LPIIHGHLPRGLRVFRVCPGFVNSPDRRHSLLAWVRGTGLELKSRRGQCGPSQRAVRDAQRWVCRSVQTGDVGAGLRLRFVTVSFSRGRLGGFEFGDNLARFAPTWLCRRQGRHCADAEPLFKRSLAIWRKRSVPIIRVGPGAAVAGCGAGEQRVEGAAGGLPNGQELTSSACCTCVRMMPLSQWLLKMVRPPGSCRERRISARLAGS
jgi:hypothetical protein